MTENKQSSLNNNSLREELEKKYANNPQIVQFFDSYGAQYQNYRNSLESLAKLKAYQD